MYAFFFTLATIPCIVPHLDDSSSFTEYVSLLLSLQHPRASELKCSEGCDGLVAGGAPARGGGSVEGMWIASRHPSSLGSVGLGAACACQRSMWGHIVLILGPRSKSLAPTESVVLIQLKRKCGEKMGGSKEGAEILGLEVSQREIRGHENTSIGPSLH